MSFQRLHEMRKEVAKDTVSENAVGHLSLFKYTPTLVWGKNGAKWNKTNIKARGIVFDTRTGTVVARSFSKFFNLGERANTKIKALEKKLKKQKLFATKKIDGTCLAIWHHDGEWHTSTPGALKSPQAVYAAKTYLPKYDFDALPTDLTYVFEMIAPFDRYDKVLDYGDQDDITLLAAFETRWEEAEVPRSRLEMLANTIGLPIVQEYPIDQEKPWDTTIPDGEEGCVFRFDDGQRVKFKGRWYMRWHRIADSISFKNVIDLLEHEQYTIDQMANHAPPNVKNKLDDFLSYISTVKERIEQEVDKWWADTEDPSDHKACAAYFKQAGPIQTILFDRMKNRDEQHNLWKHVRRVLREEGLIGSNA